MTRLPGLLVVAVLWTVVSPAQAAAQEILVQHEGNDKLWDYRGGSMGLGEMTVDPSAADYHYDRLGYNDVAQSICLDGDARITAVEIFIVGNDDCKKGVVLTLCEDADGVPSSELIAPGARGVVGAISSKGGFQRFKLTKPVEVKGGQVVWMVLAKVPEKGKNMMYSVPNSIKDGNGPRDWYAGGMIGGRGPYKDRANPSKWGAWHSQDAYFRVFGRYVGERAKKKTSREAKPIAPYVDDADTLPEPVPGPFAEFPLYGNYPVQIYEPQKKGEPKRLDAEAMIDALIEQGSQVTCFLIWHNENDWEELQRFLPPAAEKDLEVWAYLAPPSETGFADGKMNYSEPFRLDYIRWAKELAKLSRKHPNLKAWVIDDFGGNLWLYSPDYMKKMIGAMKEINPHFAFLPLLYGRQIRKQHATDYGDFYDGVVFAYPEDEADIARARKILGDKPLVIMPPAAEYMYESNRKRKATEENFVEEFRMVTGAIEKGLCDGIIPYRGALIKSHITYKAIKKAYGEAQEE